MHRAVSITASYFVFVLLLKKYTSLPRFRSSDGVVDLLDCAVGQFHLGHRIHEIFLILELREEIRYR